MFHYKVELLILKVYTWISQNIQDQTQRSSVQNNGTIQHMAVREIPEERKGSQAWEDRLLNQQGEE